jgi:hypothetical protein
VYAPRAAVPPGWGPNTVVIPAADFEDGRLPAICAVTGQPATANLQWRYAGTPQWVGCLFLISWMALLVAYLFTHQEVRGRLPVTSAIAVRVESLHQAGALGFFAGIVTAILAAVAGIVLSGTAGTVVVTALLALTAIALLTWIVTSVMESRTLGIKGFVTKDGFGTRWVLLRGVHPAFVQAVANSRR